MSIVDVKPKWSGEMSEGSADENLTQSSRRRRDLLKWTVLTDGTEANAGAVRTELANSFGFVIGGLHPSDSFLRANSIRLARVAPIFYELDAGFTTKGAEAGQSPLDIGLRIKQSFATSVESIDNDIDGNAIVTPNGEGYDPPITDEISDLVLEFERNFASWDYITAWTYMERGAINSDEFLGFPPGAARIRGLEAESVEAEDFIYFRGRMRVQFRNAAPGSDVSKAWYKRVLCQGFWTREVAGGPVNKFTDKAKPVLLKADGTKVDKDAGDVEFWQEFQTAPKKPFGALGFFD